MYPYYSILQTFHCENLSHSPPSSLQQLLSFYSLHSFCFPEYVIVGIIWYVTISISEWILSLRDRHIKFLRVFS